jgi:hypothetical protein
VVGAVLGVAPARRVAIRFANYDDGTIVRSGARRFAAPPPTSGRLSASLAIEVSCRGS